MSENPLKVIASEQAARQMKQPSPKERQQIAKARFEREWMKNPAQFDPQRNARERSRITRTLRLIDQEGSLEGKKVADLACGYALLTRALRDRGAEVDAVDIAEGAISRLKSDALVGIHPIVQGLPHTTLSDNHYDLILCTELIGELHPFDQRILVSELARLINKEGHLICSTSLDIDSEDPLEEFSVMIQTEFEIASWVLSYHSLTLRLLNFFRGPGLYYRASKDKELFQDEMRIRSPWSQRLFRWNTSTPLAHFWGAASFITDPIARWINRSDRLTTFLENIRKALGGPSNASHVIVVAKRRPLAPPVPPEEQPIERKHKREVWE